VEFSTPTGWLDKPLLRIIQQGSVIGLTDVSVLFYRTYM